MTDIKKRKKYKKVYHQKKLKFQDYENCLNPAKIDRKLKHWENKKLNIDKLKELVKNTTKI